MQNKKNKKKNNIRLNEAIEYWKFLYEHYKEDIINGTYTGYKPSEYSRKLAMV